MYDFLNALIRPGDLVFDIGANIGTMVDIYLALGARVIAVEPICEYGLEITRRHPNVTVINKAISKDVNLTVYKCGALSSAVPAHWYRGRFAYIKPTESVIVATTTLDALIADYGVPRYIKIDCEGYDRTVISTLTTPNVPILSFEYLEENHQIGLDTINDLKPLGFTHFNLMWGGMHPFFDGYLDLATFLDRFHGMRHQIWGDIVAINMHALGDLNV